jgi:catechol 2,3-dioxygenase-like lactoylglutathione lyase family enzyme
MTRSVAAERRGSGIVAPGGSMANEQRPRLTAVAPMFLVDDVERTAEWYHDHLGFTIGDYFREEEHDHEHPHPEGADGSSDHSDGIAEFVILTRENGRLMLGRTVEPGVRDRLEHRSERVFVRRLLLGRRRRGAVRGGAVVGYVVPAGTQRAAVRVDRVPGARH